MTYQKITNNARIEIRVHRLYLRLFIFYIGKQDHPTVYFLLHGLAFHLFDINLFASLHSYYTLIAVQVGLHRSKSFFGSPLISLNESSTRKSRT